MREWLEGARNAARSGRWDEAQGLARRLLAADPHSLAAIEILVLASRARGDLAQAEALLRQAIAIDPAQRWPYGDLARLLIDQARGAEAETLAWQALRADPGNADALMLLGRLELERGLLIEAEGHLAAAIALVGRHPQLVLLLARAIMFQSRIEEARRLFGEALAGQPQSIEGLAALAELEERAGNFDAAVQLLDRAEPLARRQGDNLDLQRAVLLARMGRQRDALVLLEGAGALSGAARLQRGRLRDQLGQHGAAWDDWTAAKQQIAAQTGRGYDRGAVEREAAVLRSFAERLPAGAAAATTDGAQPVFIVGFPRSGTTLVEQIAAAHDQVHAGGELPFGPELRDLAASRLGGPTALHAWLEQGGDETAGQLAQVLRDHYLSRAASYRLTGGKTALFTDKMPLNELWLPLIRLAFPAARIVRIVRHPLDILVSALSHDMTHGHNFAYRLEDAVHYMALIDRQLRAYRQSGLRIDHVLRYEDLIGDQKGETARLMAVLGLELQDAQLSFHRAERIAPTPSYAQVREPLNKRSIARWHHYAGQLAPARVALGEMIAALGYEDQA